jgi:hypothetical protein
MMNGESANAQDARVEALWSTLDTDNVGYLDLARLRKGLRKMDHRAHLLLLSFDHQFAEYDLQLSKTRTASSKTS